MIENLDPEFRDLMLEGIVIAQRASQLGNVMRFDVLAGTGSGGMGPAAELCRSQAALARENIQVMTELADVYDRFGAYFERHS
jgi:hypothetical protein